MAIVRIGTASWTDRSLIACGRYYPPDCTSPASRLRYYASQFSLVEVDSSYYALPSVRNSALWIERTPDGFVFDIKAFRLFTGHQTPAESLPADLRRALPHNMPRPFYYRDVAEELRDELWRRFLEAIGPLRDAAKLGVVLLQFPPWVRPGARVQAHIAECRSKLAGFAAAVEFRNRLWLEPAARASSFALLRELGLGYVAVDEPQGFESSVPPIAEVTGPIALVRFHGRNRATWQKRGFSSSAERFDYYYRGDELAEWLPRIEAMRREARELHLVFNTNKEDQGPVNALLLSRLLDDGSAASEELPSDDSRHRSPLHGNVI